MRRLPLLAALALGPALVLAGCGASPTTSPAPASPTPAAGHVQPTGTPAVLATDLDLPWSMVRVGEATLISQRDDAHIARIDAAGTVTDLGQVPGVKPGAEGGLLGLATVDLDGTTWIYAYLTSPDDNRIVRMPYVDDRLGEPEVVLSGIAKAGNHNGGRIAFGPDGMLYATVGDAENADSSQNPESLNGKILRLTPEGEVPDDNPFAGSFVYSLGHRNPQGIAWDADGQLWAAEFGQNTWDEFNRIEAGANYGWPIVEGQGGVDGYVDPVLQWATSEASPSGLAYLDGTFFLAALRGERIWSIDVADDGSAAATPWFVGEFGRIRDIAAGPDGSMWFLTSNTSTNGTPREGDDKLLRVELTASGS